MVCVVLIVCKNQGANMSYQFCTTSLADKILTVTINRPESMNALHPDANAELAHVFDTFAANPDQWVAIITGAGDRAFSAGNDLKYQASGGKMSVPDSGFAGLTSRFDLTKPVIAAVNGVAMGGGFEIALACDLIIAADTAVFALPEPKVGLAALAGGLHRLPRQIGLKNAMGMILTGRRVSAAEGATLGFVNEVVPAADLMATALKWAQMITANAPSSVRASKQASYQGLNEPSLEAAYKAQYKYDAVRAMFASPNLIEGPMAFAQKRAAKWVG
jgi:enoyl-CoA hydratase/carnithine racemase